MARETDITVLGGLPVTVEYETYAAEPDVGIMSGGVDDWWIVAINGRPVKKCDWLYRRIEATKGERERIREELDEIANEPDDYYDDY
ncbi:hypothetical protein [Sphingomonas phage Kharn]|uniref:Uncharacterized protein n=1 Tax=Sphingomonas phage Kharn TaxID=2686312 RepID=A0A6M3T8B8_9CAUD|nr:hypothetical protein P9A29_gp45 [Sphingomonas phage Kharn]QJD54547.1 hypothetical protein [Sphingomonas phage Kharn]